jgi:acetoin utilization deacetylase AcuC-like enzyme
MLPVRGLVQPGGGLPENPETKRRLLNLLHASGLARDLALSGAEPALREDLLRVHPASYLDEFRRLSDAGGGELGPRAPFGHGGYDLAALSAGLAREAVFRVLRGEAASAYALSRPPGHHALPAQPMGFCLLANGAVAVEAALAARLAERVAVLDWDVHHGNGTEAIFLARPDVLTVSLHQENNFPLDTGAFEARGEGPGEGFNLNIPLPPGTGHKGYLLAMERLALPAIRRFRPDLLVVACGFDAALNDPLGRMMATAETFRLMTRMVLDLCRDTGARLALIHEGGYSETYVPFCGHAVLEELSGSSVAAPDPIADIAARRQPGPAFDRFVEGLIAGMAEAL